MPFRSLAVPAWNYPVSRQKSDPGHGPWSGSWPAPHGYPSDCSQSAQAVAAAGRRSQDRSWPGARRQEAGGRLPRCLWQERHIAPSTLRSGAAAGEGDSSFRRLGGHLGTVGWIRWVPAEPPGTGRGEVALRSPGARASLGARAEAGPREPAWLLAGGDGKPLRFSLPHLCFSRFEFSLWISATRETTARGKRICFWSYFS